MKDMIINRPINKILFIRRDNIGDLICTTPAIHAVRGKYPDAKIGILVNTYNADAIINNHDIDELYIYEKAKHVPHKNKFLVWWNNFKMLLKIRKEHYDVAIGCGSHSPRLARYTFLTGASIRIGYLKNGMGKSIFYNMPLYETGHLLHEVEKTYNLLSPLNLTGTPPQLNISPLDEEVNKCQDFLNASGVKKETPLIAFHISSRRSENRWPAERFIELGRLISDNCNATILILWSPGSEKNVYHPGDDEKAEAVRRALNNSIAYKTTKLRELIAAISLSRLVICCDGGAMHIAAALKKPVITIWGSTNPEIWRPWGAKHIILQDKTKRAENIKVHDVFNAIIKKPLI